MYSTALRDCFVPLGYAHAMWKNHVSNDVIPKKKYDVQTSLI